jgi:hypothetical protein
MNQMSDQEARQLHIQVLRHFSTAGRAPTLSEMGAMIGNDSGIAEEYLEILEKWGVIYRDPHSRDIRAAYPFSGVPTSHRVTLGNGIEVYAMCAIDALGMPFMLDTDVTIRSVCYHCGKPIAVNVEKYAVVRAKPSEVVVWHETSEGCCVAAVDLCPHVNFFCSPNELAQWRTVNPSQKGKELSLAVALDRGREVFGSLLKWEKPTKP